MRRISRLKRSLGVSALASVLLLSGLAAAAAPAAANDVMCTRSGNTLTWNAPANNSPVHVRGWVDNVNSKWLTKLAGQTSYNLTATDLAKAPADLFFIRFTTGGVRTDVQCTNGPGNPGGNGFCQQDGTTLTWSQESPKNNVFHVRKVNADFSTSWVATVQAANPNTYQAPSANDSYVIRYRKTNQLGQTNVINENCSQDAEPPAARRCAVGNPKCTVRPRRHHGRRREHLLLC